ncbi:S1 family peptidase [Gloeothece verrucosa]|uniref:Serine protease n=1 Tax=Gloeothece verrucosa (strain PCC 7822) TaxID=497965 RepID=E0U9M4_GLOV7|nr:serine protease [Gloeothece verrucosa]ADN13825.1 conserved hypothetical protein [Gloeothece verrucosa PCC 7822]
MLSFREIINRQHFNHKNEILPINLIHQWPLALIFLLFFFPSAAKALEPQQIAQQAQQTTVKITGSGLEQSGILITEDKNTYWIMTCTPKDKSVLNKAKIIAPDGQPYESLSAQIIHLNQFPISLIPVQINRSYETANMGDSNSIKLGERVYIAGFMPASDNRRNPQFIFTEGIISSLAEQPPKSGFTHTNPIYPGMEGTPIFSQQGTLIGISCQNSTLANRQKKDLQLNWGIPITPLTELAQQKGLSFGFSALGSPPPSPNP